MFTLDTLLKLLEGYKYAAMFGVLFLCGLGLPMPEEITLIASGLAVGWEKANFWLASLSCVLGILAGDSFIFALGRYCGKSFLSSRPMRLLLNESRQAKIDRLFAKHGNKAVFFARFLPGVRIGVYAYAGQHGLGWVRFLVLDCLGALISGPTSIWIGSFAARKLADPNDAAHEAQRILHEGSYVLYALVALVVLLGLGHWWWSHRSAPRKCREPGPEETESDSREAVTTAADGASTPGREARRGEEPR